MMILGVGLELGKPDDLLGIYRLAVDNGGDLSVASACVEAYAAAA